MALRLIGVPCSGLLRGSSFPAGSLNPESRGVLVKHFFTMLFEMPAVESPAQDPGEAALRVGWGLEVGTQTT